MIEARAGPPPHPCALPAYQPRPAGGNHENKGDGGDPAEEVRHLDGRPHLGDHDQHQRHHKGHNSEGIAGPSVTAAAGSDGEPIDEAVGRLPAGTAILARCVSGWASMWAAPSPTSSTPTEP